MVDLPLDTREAAVNAITLPEVFHDFDTARRNLEDLNLEDQLSISQVHYLKIMFDERRTFLWRLLQKKLSWVIYVANVVSCSILQQSVVRARLP